MPSAISTPGAPYRGNGKYLNSGSGDSVIGGAISTLPSSLNAQAFNTPAIGTRMILSEEDALAASDVTNVGTLYGGMYQYVTVVSTAIASPARGKAAFWDTSVVNKKFQVTPDESGNQGVAMFAGVFINTLTAGYSWWILQAGRVYARMKAAFTGVPSDGCAVYLAAAGAGEPGVFDVLDGGGNPTFTQVGQMLQRYVGVANGLPVAAGIGTTVEIPFNRNFRW